MFHFTIGFSFLFILLIPIGFFMVSLVYLTGEELRKNHYHKQHMKSKKATKVEDIPRPERIRVVK
ncbi:hypothetical protein [Alkaliphilus transvaalensis]|uniref:hypothetical protein n=1 Tax=Alkaliphilus transvaalensis TaxID=114628 RepID=UPI00047EDFDC|nr:hypothetical protein [Alkaliphilus transvaalensis]